MSAPGCVLTLSCAPALAVRAADDGAELRAADGAGVRAEGRAEVFAEDFAAGLFAADFLTTGGVAGLRLCANEVSAQNGTTHSASASAGVSGRSDGKHRISFSKRRVGKCRVGKCLVCKCRARKRRLGVRAARFSSAPVASLFTSLPLFASLFTY
jgi:hypothetical protein